MQCPHKVLVPPKKFNFTHHRQSLSPIGKSIILTIEDHKKVVSDGMGVVHLVNEGPFLLGGDPLTKEMKPL